RHDAAQFCDAARTLRHWRSGRARRRVSLRPRIARIAPDRPAGARRDSGGGGAVTGHLDLIRSAYAGTVWPGGPPATGALALALQFQLERSQWQAPEALRAAQFRQLGALLQHAQATVPFYRERLDAAKLRPGQSVTEDQLALLPVLTRGEVHAAGAALHS